MAITLVNTLKIIAEKIWQKDYGRDRFFAFQIANQFWTFRTINYTKQNKKKCFLHKEENTGIVSKKNWKEVTFQAYKVSIFFNLNFIINCN